MTVFSEIFEKHLFWFENDHMKMQSRSERLANM